MKKIFFFSFLVSLVIISNPLPSVAASTGIAPTPTSGNSDLVVQIPNPLKTKTFSELINRIANWLLIIGAPILALFIIIGAFQIMTSGGTPDKVTTGRKTITYAIIGYALLMLSKSVTLIINNVLGVR